MSNVLCRDRFLREDFKDQGTLPRLPGIATRRFREMFSRYAVSVFVRTREENMANTFDLAYGNSSLKLVLPDYVDPLVLRPREIPGLAHPTEAVAEALASPSGSKEDYV